MFAVGKEFQRVTTAWIRHGAVGLPVKLLKSALTGSRLDPVWDDARVRDLIGEATLDLFDALGPVYGKAAQIGLSRLTPALQQQAEALRLTRLYADWPPLPYAQVSRILDREIPRWRSELSVDSKPLGVASMAQVHAATDTSGRKWVVKIIKPQAHMRMTESLAALEQVVNTCAPFAVTLTAKRMVRETRELAEGLRRELDLGRERETIERVCRRLKPTSQSLLRIPEVHPRLCTDNVLVIERFEGTPLSKIVADHRVLPANQRRKLAKKMLQELLVQVFEVGLFHADPHAGNLILLDDGSVGLFDWGLAGELLESDRKHIAGMLKAVIALDMEQLVEVLQQMARDGNRDIRKTKIRKEMARLTQMVKRGEEDPSRKPSLQELIEACLKSAARLGIPIPNGLLLMAKSLITIEGLAKGIDPEVSLKRIATPVLFRAARPTLTDMLGIAKKLPTLMKKGLFK